MAVMVEGRPKAEADLYSFIEYKGSTCKMHNTWILNI